MTIDRPPSPITSTREIDHLFHKYKPIFAGKETEHNWHARDDALRQIHKIMSNEAVQLSRSDKEENVGTGWSKNPALVHAIAQHICQLMDAFLVAANSLRTALSISACNTISQCILLLRSNMDPVCETVFISITKLLSSTKKLVQAAASQCVATLVVCCPVNRRMADRIAKLMDQKNAQFRHHAILFIYELFYFASKSSLNDDVHMKYSDVWERAIKVGVSDQNANVRLASRDCVFLYQKLEPCKAKLLISKLDSAVCKILAKGPLGSTDRQPILSGETVSLIQSMADKLPAHLSAAKAVIDAPAPAQETVISDETASNEVVDAQENATSVASKVAEYVPTNDAAPEMSVESSCKMDMDAPMPAQEISISLESASPVKPVLL